MNDEANLYYVVRMGNYNRGVYYISSNFNDCQKRAVELAESDIDSYHRYEVYRCNNDMPVVSEKDDGYPYPEIEALFSINKDESTAEAAQWATSMNKVCTLIDPKNLNN